MGCPPQSSDLNHIENKWNLLKQRLFRFENVPSGINELWERICKVWYEDTVLGKEAKSIPDGQNDDNDDDTRVRVVRVIVDLDRSVSDDRTGNDDDGAAGISAGEEAVEDDD
ncbi:hypothetical protein BDC45DRAFT_593475 [Circinella umbellata]|nr:hypothetical protein BDC45DRAFT_593475 [Circinella umbellata]